jgi:hypothetical protein
MAGMASELTIYRITLACSGVPPELGSQGAIDITEEFIHRPWHQNARCEWDGVDLILRAENDYDNGRSLMDEFSDSISAYISKPFDGNIEVRSIEVLG